MQKLITLFLLKKEKNLTVIIMNENLLKHVKYWPIALPRDLNRDYCHTECFGSRSKPYSFGKSDRDQNSTTNMKLEEMFFTSQNKK